MTIVEWVTEGLKLVNEKGKTVDDLIVYLKNAEGLSRFFDKYKLCQQFPQPVSKTDEFGKSEQLGRSSKWNLDGSCPRCGKHSLQTYGNFCCYCGADMRGKDVPVSDVPLNRGLVAKAEEGE